MRKKEQPVKEAISPKDFYTRQAANEGVKLPLSLPDGTPSEHWLLIRGVDSDAFREANDAEIRRLVDIAKDASLEERQKALQESKLRLLAALVAGWSFSHELTPESATEFMREAPHIAEAVNKLSARRALFFKKPSAS